MSTLEDTRVTSQVFLTDENELIFNFKPEDLSFSKPANLILNYNLLIEKLKGQEPETLVLKWWNPDIEDWVEVSTSETSNKYYKWDSSRKRVTFLIDHFSIYLISKD